MRFFFDPTASPQAPDATLFVGTSNYLEVQEPAADGTGVGLSYTYISYLEPGSFVISACWDREFDPFAPFLSDPRMGGHWLAAYSEPWPTFGRLLSNASRGRLADGCLVNFQDPDDGENKWHVVTFVGNLPHTTDWAEIAEQERVLEACRLVYVRSVELLLDMMSGREISPGTKAKGFFKAAIGVQRDALESSWVWLDRIERITKLMGSS
jgi:hypothetical protein